jgi:leader peptidase (prepilin peptidase)/N-methyltransferase
MSFLIQTGSFVFGLIIGSFLNVVIYRLKAATNLLGFSACPRCRHRLAALDLVPVLSFLLLGGKCRYCRQPISCQYPAVEFATGLTFLLLARQNLLIFSPRLSAAQLISLGFGFLFISLLIIIFTFDFKYYLIPDAPVFLGVAAAFLYRWLSQELSITDGLWGMLLVAGFFGLLYLISGGAWIGLGDVKLGLFLGSMLGLKLSAVMLAGAYFSGALVGVVLVLWGRKTMQGALPFGTFLTAASFFTLLWGQPIWEWYMAFFYR